MAEAHPVGFQWVMEAKKRGATVIHVDPRFTRTSALADRFVGIRAGTDVAFLGGIVNYVLSNELDFREYVLAYTNAASIVREDFRDTEDLDGLFSGFDRSTRTYDERTWQYEGQGEEGETEEQTLARRETAGGLRHESLRQRWRPYRAGCPAFFVLPSARHVARSDRPEFFLACS